MSKISAITPDNNERASFMQRHAMDCMDNELDRLLIMAQVLVRELEPQDPKNPKDTDRITAWRLAEVLCDRLSDARFDDSLREMVLGEQGAKSA